MIAKMASLLTMMMRFSGLKTLSSGLLGSRDATEPRTSRLLSGVSSQNRSRGRSREVGPNSSPLLTSNSWSKLVPRWFPLAIQLPRANYIPSLTSSVASISMETASMLINKRSLRSSSDTSWPTPSSTITGNRITSLCSCSEVPCRHSLIIEHPVIKAFSLLCLCISSITTLNSEPQSIQSSHSCLMSFKKSN